MHLRSLAQSLAYAPKMFLVITWSNLFILQTRKLDSGGKSDLFKVIWPVSDRAKTRSRQLIQVFFLLYHSQRGRFSFIHQLQAERGWNVVHLIMFMLGWWRCQSQDQEHPAFLAPMRSGASWAWRGRSCASYIETLSLGLSSPDEADFCKALSNCPLITNLSFGSWNSRTEKWDGVVSPLTAFKHSGNRQNLCVHPASQGPEGGFLSQRHSPSAERPNHCLCYATARQNGFQCLTWPMPP